MNHSSIWQIFLECFAVGMVAFTLPCIFPLAPLTISFFTKQQEQGKPFLVNALLYWISIISIYVGLGLLVTLIYGAGALNELASDAYFNLIIFAILLAFSASLLGYFELTLPQQFVNLIANKAGTENFVSLFFLAATLAVVSFSCTGPLIGSILVSVSHTDSYYAPVIGMFGFSFALASIFLMLALFPQSLKLLPKSGAWLNSVKVGLGLLEIGLALKFLSNADLAYHWGILSRELFLGIWITLILIFTLNIVGWIRFPHDSRIDHISWPRLGISFVNLCVVGWMLPGLWGAPLNALSGFLPPHKISMPTVSTPRVKKYQDLFQMPHDIDGFFDYEEALAYARQANKPLLLDFTGHGCVNCRKMEAEVWSDPRVLAILKQQFVLVSLYTDDKTPLPENEVFDSALLKTRINTVGKRFKELQARHFKTISQPYYVLLDPQEQLLVSPPIGVELDIERYLAYLNTGLANFKTPSN